MRGENRISILDGNIKKNVVFGAVIATVLIISSAIVISWLGMNSTNLAVKNAPKIFHSERISTSLQKSQIAIYNLITFKDEKYKKEWKETWDLEVTPSVNVLFRNENLSNLIEDENKALKKMLFSLKEEQRKVIDKTISKFVNVAELDYNEDLKQVYGLINLEVLPLVKDIESKLNFLEIKYQKQIADNTFNIKILVPIAITILVVFMMFIVFYSYRFSKNLKKIVVDPVLEILKISKAVKDGNYEIRANKINDDEIGDLSDCFNQMIGSFEDITEVAESASEGDFSKKVNRKYEFGKLGKAVNKMNVNLIEVVSQAEAIAQGDYSGELELKGDKDALGKVLNKMISNLKKNNEELEISEKLNSAIVSTVPNSIITMKSDQIITSYNQTAFRIFGYKSSEVIGKKLEFLIPDIANTNHQQFVKNYTKSGERKISKEDRIEFARKKDGTYFPIYINIGQSEVEGSILYTVVIRDTTREENIKSDNKKRNKEIEREHWLKSSLSEVFESIKDTNGLSDLLDKILSKVAEQLNIGIGAIYLNNQLIDEKNNSGVTLLAQYAFSGEEVKKQYGIGNGIVGQVAKELKVINLKPVPEDYLKIESSLGATVPAEILVLPIKRNKKMIGVVELGSLKEFNSYDVAYLEEMISSVAIVILNEIERNRTDKLSNAVNNQIQAINRSTAAVQFDGEGNIIDANKLFLDLMKYRLEDIVGKHHSIFVYDGEEKTVLYKDFWKKLKKGEFVAGEFKRKNSLDENVWINGSYNPILDANGKVDKILKIATDITEQKKNEFKLLEEKEKTDKLSAAVKNQIQAINKSNAAIEFDKNGIVLEANDLFLALMEYQLEDIVGKHHSIFVKKDEEKSVEYKDFWNKLNKGEFVSGEFKRKSSSNKDVWINGSYNPIFDIKGNVDRVLKIAIDITAQKKYELELLAQKEKLVTQEEELRVTNDELITQTIQLKASEEELRVQQEELAEANTELEEQSQQLEEKNKDMVSYNEALKNASLTLEIKAKELEDSSRFKSEFLANMSHELRTPLNSILILSKLLGENKTSNLTEKQIEFASVINNSGSDLLKLINEVLDLSKVESGMTELDFGNHKLEKFIDGLKSTFYATAKDKKVNFDIVKGEKLPEIIWTDELRLSQIIKNLLSNAFKFTPEKGTVSLLFDVISPKAHFKMDSLRNSDKILTIEVTDTGIGIEESKLDLVFQAFKQADGSTQRKYGGTGLGLSISKELVHLLKGEIELKSVVDEGSTFTVYLPLEEFEEIVSEVEAEVEEEVLEKTSIVLPTISSIAPVKKVEKEKRYSNLKSVIADDRAKIEVDSKSILIVEDDLAFAKVVLDISRENKFKGVVIDNGLEVEKYIQHFSPSAIILDMKLPGKDGWTVLKELKAGPYAHIPVHVMTGMDKKSLGIELGAVDYLIKPISLEKMNSTFEKIGLNLESGLKQMLIIEDDKNQNIAIKELISRKELVIDSAYNGNEALEKIKSKKMELVILDLGLPDCDGIDLFHKIKKIDKKISIIVFTGRELKSAEIKQFNKYKNTAIVLKTHASHDRLLDEVELFMNYIEKNEDSTKTVRVKKIDDLPEVLKGKKILCVDDDMRNIYSLQVVLEAEGIEVVVATNGEEAVEIVSKDDTIDCVLMDIMMPVMDGYEATAQIRKMGKARLPIIALTAKAMKGDREKCLEAGLSDYLSKPLDIVQLLSILRVWMYDKQ